MAVTKQLVLIDGHSLAFRVYYGLERTGMSTSDGMPVWAVYGFCNALFSLLKKISPDAIAVTFDVGRETFRTEMYDQYKANRESMPEEMKVQMDTIREAVEVLGIPIYELPGYEADDVIGTLSRQAAEEGWKVDILTGDQDSFQLVEDDKVEILVPARTPKDEMKRYTRQAVFEKMGVWPEQVTDFKGLKGDTSDNIPGVAGVGDKTAAKLLAEYETLEKLYEHLDEVKGKLQDKLRDSEDIARLSKKLAIIDRQSPISADFSQCKLSVPNLEVLMAFLNKMEFKNFIKQAPQLLQDFLTEAQLKELTGGESKSEGGNGQSADITPQLSFSVKTVDEGQMPKTSTTVVKNEIPSFYLRIPHQLILTDEQLTVLVQNLKKAKVFALDIETTGLNIFEDSLVGISIAYYGKNYLDSNPWQLSQRKSTNLLNLAKYPESFSVLEPLDSLNQTNDDDIETVYIPIGHCHPDDVDTVQLSEQTVLTALKPLLEDSDLIKIAHNAKFEVNFFKKLQINWQGLVLDTMVASYVLDSGRKHGLKSLSQSEFQQQMQPITDLIGTGKKQIPFSEVIITEAREYAACDAFVTLKLAAKFMGALAKNGTLATLFYEIEMPLALVLAQMERTGIGLDVPHLAKLSKELEAKLAVVEQDIWGLSGLPFNINSPKQVGDVLFGQLGIQPLKKTKGKTGYSTDAKVLEQLSEEHDIVAKILDYRQLFKLKSTYVDSLPTMVQAKTNRIHTSFNQTITATGRLSSSDPNLQNIPIRTDAGKLIRAAFIPGQPGQQKLYSADYSQIELRMLAHYSEDPNLIAAFNSGEDIHQATAALVFDVAKEDVTKEMRYKAKAVNFGVIYGQTPHGLSQQLKITRAEAAEFIERYFEQYPSVQAVIEQVQQEAKEHGFVTTIAGRVRDLSKELNSPVRNIREFAERAAFNTVLQGSAADLIKVAMIRVARTLEEENLQSRLLLQVHDEIVLEVPNNELEQVEELVTWAMSLNQPLKVPLVIDREIGDNWLEQ